jgi:hypothetical protein
MPKSLISFLKQESLFLGSNQVRAVSHVTHIPALFAGSFSDYRRTYAFHKQHSTNSCMLCLQNGSLKKRMMASSCITSEPVRFYLWAMLKDKQYSSSHHTDRDLNKSILDAAFSISPAYIPGVI